jgi:para-nitrobenzyl esterase
VRSLALLLGIVLTTGCAQEALLVADPESARSLPAGDVVGGIGRYGSHTWLGIRYAQPPLGELRWRAPRAAPRRQEVQQALQPADPCPQYASPFAGSEREASGVVGKEDCLTLDVWAPRLDPVAAREAKLPVMVWIHGGGQSIGSSSFYDGGNLAATHDLVVVAVQYRLGPLGWLRHAALRTGVDPIEASGNFGTLDLILALGWVRENIAGFGGDPGNVTIFGESAGGTNVMSLLLTRSARGLFHRAILQSPGFSSEEPRFAEDFHDADEPGHVNSANELIARLLIADGEAGDREEARTKLRGLSLHEVADWLRSKSPAELLAGYPDSDGMLFFPSLFRDGVVQPREAPLAAIEQGDYAQVPVMLGTNRDENKLFMAFDPELASWRFDLFPVPNDPERYQAQAEAQARAWKARGVDAPARAMHAAQGDSVYAYRWDWDEEPRVPGLYDGGFVIGAAHGLEIPFVFGHWDVGPETFSLFNALNRGGREALSAAMMSYWAEFAYNGSPARGRARDLPEWSAWDGTSESAPKYAVLDTEEGGGIRMASETWTLERVVGHVLADPRLESVRDRCAVLASLARWEDLSAEAYATAGDATCKDFALDAYPWAEFATRGD